MWSTFTLIKRHYWSPVLGRWNNCVLEFLTRYSDDPVLSLFVIKMNSLSISFWKKWKKRPKTGKKIKRKRPNGLFIKEPMERVDPIKPNFPLSKFWKTLTSLRVIYCPCVTISLFFVEVEVVQIHYIILQVQSDQHEPELLGSPCSFYRSCSSPLIPDQHSKGICSCHCPSFVHLSIYVLYPLSEKT